MENFPSIPTVGAKEKAMGIGKFFKSFVSDEALGEQTVETTVTIFARAQRQQPYEETHAWLASTWLNRMKARGQNINDPDMHMLSFSETYLHACIKPPLCARSLGLYFLYKENPHVLEKYPKFANEYATLMGPVLQAQEDGTIENLYKRYNPKMAAEADK